MWPGTLAKFQIGESAFNKVSNPAIVGIYSVENNKTAQSLVDPEVEVHIRRSITVGSYLRDCVGFAMHKEAVDILKSEHFEVLQAYIKTIPQEQLFIFEDGSKYSSAMMQILVEISKKFLKSVTCLGVLPYRYEGTRALASFNQSWDVIKELADDAIIFDFEMTDLFKQIRSELDMDEIVTMRQQAIFKKVAGMESEFEKVEYPSRR